MTEIGKRMKILYLMRIFNEETDEAVGLTMPQIIGRLSEMGISAERKAVYRDIEALRQFGMDIRVFQRAPVEYALVNRRFSLPELLLMTDAVQSSRFLTKGKSEDLVRSIKTLASKREAKSLSKRMHVEGRIKMQNESVYHNVDIIQEALRLKRKVEFQYYKYDLEKNKKLQHDGMVYMETPVQLIYSDGYYYLVVYNDKHTNFTNYRVDRMVEVKISEERATRNADIATFDVTEYESRAFGMYRGEAISVDLLVKEDAMSGVIDRFGKDVQVTPYDDEHAKVHAVVMESPVFYGWVAQYGDSIRIVQPKRLVDGYVDYLKGIIGSYE
jgi:predicted DNA-binding transcriptional regulator YafY